MAEDINLVRTMDAPKPPMTNEHLSTPLLSLKEQAIARLEKEAAGTDKSGFVYQTLLRYLETLPND
jgi:hypothetical protein